MHLHTPIVKGLTECVSLNHVVGRVKGGGGGLILWPINLERSNPFKPLWCQPHPLFPCSLDPVPGSELLFSTVIVWLHRMQFKLVDSVTQLSSSNPLTDSRPG